jgi:hypothetical protein
VAGGRFNCRAAAGVTPNVVGAGRSGCCPITGRACASCAGSTRWNELATGRDPVIAAVGTIVAARRLTKLLKVTLRLIVVKLATCETLTCRK